MGRTHLYSDRVQIIRTRKRIVRGENVGETPAAVGDWIPCLLRTPSGKADEMEVRVSVPEAAILIVHVKDDSGAAVTIKQGDQLSVRFNKDHVLVDRPALYRIMGDIVETREKRRVVSYQLQVQMESEH